MKIIGVVFGAAISVFCIIFIIKNTVDIVKYLKNKRKGARK